MPGDGFRPRNCVGCKVNDMFWKYHPCPYVHKLIYTRTNITKLCADIQIHIYIYSSLHLLSQLKKESHREKLGFAENDVGFFALVNPPKLGESTGIIFSWQGLRLPGHRGVFLHAGVTSHDQASVMTSCMKV